MPFLARVLFALTLSLGVAWSLLKPPPPAAEHRSIEPGDEPRRDPVADLALARSLADSEPDVAAGLAITEALGKEGAEETWRKARSALRRLADRTRLPQVPGALSGRPLAPRTLSDLGRMVLLKRLFERRADHPDSPLLEAEPGPDLEALLAAAVPVAPVPELAWGPDDEAAAAAAARASLEAGGGAWRRIDLPHGDERLRVRNPRGDPFMVTVDAFTTTLAEGVRSKQTQAEHDQSRPELDFPLAPPAGDLELVLATGARFLTLHLVLGLPGADPAFELPLELPDLAPAGAGPPGLSHRTVVRIRIPAASLPPARGTLRLAVLGLQPLAAGKITRRLDYLLQRL